MLCQYSCNLVVSSGLYCLILNRSRRTSPCLFTVQMPATQVDYLPQFTVLQDLKEEVHVPPGQQTWLRQVPVLGNLTEVQVSPGFAGLAVDGTAPLELTLALGADEPPVSDEAAAATQLLATVRTLRRRIALPTSRSREPC